MVGNCANPTCLVELHYLRSENVYLFEIDTVTGAKRSDSKAEVLLAEAAG
jgi:hypothetical protein